MNLPKAELTPDDPEKLPPARRRRSRRLLAPLTSDERTAALDSLGHRTSPSVDFYLFSLIAGAVIAAGLLFDVPAVLILGAALAPLLTPAVGVSLGTVIGSVRFFARSLTGLILGSLFYFICGAAAGYASVYWNIGLFTQANLHAQLSWPGFLLLAVGSILTTLAVVRSSSSLRPIGIHPLVSVALSYALFLPLSSAGFGLTAGQPHIFPGGLVVFALHLAWAALLGAVTLAILGFRPLTLFGYSLGGAVSLAGIILLIGMSGATAVVGAQVALPTSTPTLTFTPTPTFTRTPTLTHTLTPTPTLTPTQTPTLTSTPTLTPTPSPTPMYARVSAGGESGGAHLRTQPGFTSASKRALLNGTLVQMLPETEDVDGYLWVKVLLPPSNEDGWILLSLLSVATPSPDW